MTSSTPWPKTRPTKTDTTGAHSGRTFATQAAATQTTQAATNAGRTTMQQIKAFAAALAFAAFILILDAYLDAPQLPETNTMEYSSD
jgi:hypothetical protein